MSEPKRRRVFSPRFKLGVIERLEAGESATALSLERHVKAAKVLGDLAQVRARHAA